MVYATLQTYSDPNVFAFGDCAHCQLDARHPPLGPVLVASQQASFVDAMAARLNGRSQPMFTFNDKGSLVSLSRHKAVGELLGDVSVLRAILRKNNVCLFISFTSSSDSRDILRLDYSQ